MKVKGSSAISSFLWNNLLVTNKINE